MIDAVLILLLRPVFNFLNPHCFSFAHSIFLSIFWYVFEIVLLHPVFVRTIHTGDSLYNKGDGLLM
jgi:hypothetical protein